MFTFANLVDKRRKCHNPRSLNFAAEKLLSYKLAGITQFETILSMYSYSHFFTHVVIEQGLSGYVRNAF